MTIVRGAEPFELGNGGPGVLLVHGYTGTPFEMRPLGEVLAAAGFRVRGIRLPGHGTTPRDLARQTWADWHGAVESASAALATKTGGPVFLVGFSLGALLGLSLAHARPERVVAQAALSAPLKPAAHIRWSARLFRYSPLRPLLRLPRKRRDDEALGDLRLQNPSYDVVPMSGIVELVRRLPAIAAALPAIRVPTLVAHGAKDPTAEPAGGRAVYERLGATDKEWLLLERSLHVITLDTERGMLATAVTRFFDRHREGGC